ncbi:hypothetical protein [Pseudomonas brassicacearum]|uniref:hypothetical protein n=1 Tax=Pseudomonas brassicacearum TaxID=930166 RepID=UPI001D5D6F40|nr:hypothetical protein [Pseudomonas brassicacearum]CAH0143347.1 hypothetical protein SRABI06_00524 [Pseudomonas brassicacearum]
MQGTLEHYRSTLGGAGWFIPPYLTMGFLGGVCSEIRRKGNLFTQDDLEEVLAFAYSPVNLAAMVTERYPITPFIQDYKIIISEAVQAHFMGLDHIAVGGLMPVIEGAAKRIAADRGVAFGNIRPGFKALADNCKHDAITNSMGAVGELISMMDSFSDFTDRNLYIGSEKYPHPDMTNRHGILHGAYDDEAYGKPINFYKSIAAIDFLCLISAFKAHVSWMSPNSTTASNNLALFYLVCQQLSKRNPLKM